LLSFCFLFRWGSGADFSKRELGHDCFQLCFEELGLAELERVLFSVGAALFLAELLGEVESAVFNALNLRCVEPLNSLSFLPEAMSGLLTFCRVNSKAVLFAASPETRVLTTIRPRVVAITIFLIIHVFTYILSPVSPSILTNAVHIII